MKWYWWVLIAIVLIVVISYFVNKNLKSSKKQDLINKILEKCKTIENCNINESILQSKDIYSLQGMLIGMNDGIIR